MRHPKLIKIGVGKKGVEGGGQFDRNFNSWTALATLFLSARERGGLILSVPFNFACAFTYFQEAGEQIIPLVTGATN